MNFKEKWHKLILIIFCFLLVFGYLTFMFGKEMYYQAKILPTIEDNLGIYTSTPYVDGKEIIKLDTRPGTIASDSGLMDGDILISHTLGKFAKSIYDNRGKEFQFKVKRDNKETLITIPQIPYFEY